MSRSSIESSSVQVNPAPASHPSGIMVRVNPVKRPVRKPRPRPIRRDKVAASVATADAAVTAPANVATADAAVTAPANLFTRLLASLTGATLYEHNDILHLCLVTGTGGRTSSKWYALTPIPAEFGEAAFRLEPAMGDVLVTGGAYDVLIDGPESSCTCPGHCFSGGCKHLSALLQLHGEGRI